MAFARSSVVTFWSFLLVDQMEAMDIPEIFKQLWIKWDIRILILLSLFIQVILISLGRLRKTSASIKIQMCLWSSYLLADWVADFALGRLSGKMVGSSPSSNTIITFWAPFLILHLGGPDTITAYAIEDNELWLRHLLALCYELFAAFYVLFRSLPNTPLLAPTLLIFFVGIVKYVERIYSLYKASSNSLRRSINSTGNLVKKCFSETKSEIEALKTLTKRFELYIAFKPCFVDIDIRIEKLNEARSFLEPMEPKKVLEVMETELSYAYDELYTKAIVNHSRAGYVFRALCSICIWLAFFLYLLAPKISFDKVDMAITYVLLAASIFLDAMAIVMLLFSDWMVFSLLNVEKQGQGHWTELLAIHIVKIKSGWLKKRSWSREMPQLNFFSNCLNNSEIKEAPWQWMMNWIEEKLSLVQETKLFPGSYYGDDKTYTLRALQPIKVTQELQEIIVTQRLLNKTWMESAIRLALNHMRAPHGPDILKWIDSKERFIQYIDNLSLDLRVLVWHIATELCFHWKSEYLHSPHPPRIVIKIEDSKGKTSKKDACKYISNYMMHMVVMRPEMMSTMGGNNPSSFWHAYNSMFRFIHERGIDVQANAKVEDVCREIMPKEAKVEDVWREMMPEEAEVEDEWTVMMPKKYDKFSYDDTLNTARMLASMMLLIEEKQRWEAVITAWVELLIEGGRVSRANMHLKQLNKGGEPLTLIWLLNKHLK